MRLVVNGDTRMDNHCRLVLLMSALEGSSYCVVQGLKVLSYPFFFIQLTSSDNKILQVLYTESQLGRLAVLCYVGVFIFAAKQNTKHK